MWTQEDKEQFSPGRAHEFADKYSKMIKLLVVSVVQMSMLYAQKHTTCKKTLKRPPHYDKCRDIWFSEK